MQLYFLRHGVAEKRSQWQGDDDHRPLTDAGRTALLREALTLVRLGLKVDTIVSSPLTRARETADIVAGELGLAVQVVDDERLAHGFGRRRLAQILADHAGADKVMLVGHEPEFSETIGALTGARVVCKKGSLARIDVTGGGEGELDGELVWLLQPKVLDR
jgi:phosphohistidine phosphatase